MKELRSLLPYLLVREGLGFAVDCLIFFFLPSVSLTLSKMVSPQVESQIQALGPVYDVFHVSASCQECCVLLCVKACLSSQPSLTFRGI